MKLCLSPSRDPDEATCHLGISILAVSTVSVMERLRRDEETNAVEKSTTLTVVEIKAMRKGPPPIPTQYEPGMRLLRQYRIFLREIFGDKCAHLQEVHLIYMSLRSLQNRATEQMGQRDWAHIFWSIIVDARQFFMVCTDAEDIAAYIFLISHLGTTRSMIQANTVLSIRDTPKSCLPKPQPMGMLTRATPL